MKLFNCQQCGSLLYFENRTCEGCGAGLGYLPFEETLSALAVEGDAVTALGAADPARRRRLCVNAGRDACNWLVDADGDETFCASCRHNHIIPELSDERALTLWRRLEVAKHRLFYSLIRLGIALPNRIDDPAQGLAFDVLDPIPGQPKVLTGPRAGWTRSAPCSATSAPTIRRRWSGTTRTARRRTGSSAPSAPTPPAIRGRISPRPGRTTCTSWTRWRPPTRSASA
jgi:hypothetical protein